MTNSKLEANTGQIVNNSSWVRNDFLSNMGEEDQKKYAIGKAIQQARGGGDMAGLGKKNELHEDSETFDNATPIDGDGPPDSSKKRPMPLPKLNAI